jgi:hypothetical protein
MSNPWPLADEGDDTPAPCAVILRHTHQRLGDLAIHTEDVIRRED